MPDTEEREQRKEFLDRCFEFLKHLTTVSTAAALVLLAIYREQPFQVRLLAVAEVLFALCVCFSVYGMLNIALGTTGIESKLVKAPSHKVTDTAVLLATLLSGLLFLASVGALALALFHAPFWVVISVSVGLLVILVSVQLLICRYKRPRP